MRPVSPLRLAAALATVALVGTLAACVEPGTAPTLPTEIPATPGESPTPEPTTEPSPEAIPLDVDCFDLVDPDAVYALNPNLALLGSWRPEAGSAAAAALDAEGVACRWVLESGGGGMDVSAAHLHPDALAEREAAAASGRAVLGWGDSAYFAASGGVGTVTVFRGDVWLVISSVQFAEPAEADGIVEAALAAIPAD